MICSANFATQLIDCLEESEDQKTKYRSCIVHDIFVKPGMQGGSYITTAGRRRKIQIKR